MKTVNQILRCLISSAILFVVAQPVGATCGDWLQHAGSETEKPHAEAVLRLEHSTLDHHLTLDQVRGPVHQFDGNHPAEANRTAPNPANRSMPRPCDGPGCGGAPKPPATATDAVLSFRKFADGTLNDTFYSLQPESESYLRDTREAKRRAGFPNSLLRPPMA